MEQEKVPAAEKIISLSDSDASFIVKGGWNTLLRVPGPLSLCT